MNKEIAETIQSQLLQLGRPVIWSWGQSDLQSVSEKQAKDLGIENSLGALKFKVNGHHHKSHVIVSLNGSDTYDVFICTVIKNIMKIKDSRKGLFCDEFGTYIDNKVEYLPEYN